MKWIKIILLCCIIFIISCRKIEVTPTPPSVKNIFDAKESYVTDGQDFGFTLSTAGKYTFILYDTLSQNVVSKERFNGVSGQNTKKIWTKSLQSKYLYLSLEDASGKEIGKTLLIIN